MTSPYLSKLQESIQGARDANERLSLRAEYAGALARYGRLEQAEREIGALREANFSYAPAATAWILIAEGQVAHFRALAPEALSSFRGAHALARTIGRNDISSVAGAWMAASEYVAGKVTTAATHAVDVVLRPGPTSRSSRSRAHLVIADSLSCAGLDGAAASHYALARRFASEDGDISMQSVVLFNAAAFGVAGLTLQDCFGEVSAAKLRGVELQLESIANLDAGIGLSSLDAFVPLLRAEFMTVAKRWESAIEQYGVALGSAEQQGQDRWIAKYLSELGYCLARSGQFKLALETADAAADRLGNCTDADNRAVVHTRLAQTFALSLDEDLSESHRTKAAEEFADHSRQQRDLGEELDNILLPLPLEWHTKK